MNVYRATLLILVLGSLVGIYRMIMRPRTISSGVLLSDRQSDYLHLLMNVTMALMLSPWFDMALRRWCLWAYASAAAYLLVDTIIVAARKHRRSARRFYRFVNNAYHLFAFSVMIYATYVMPAAMRREGGSFPWPIGVIVGIFVVDGLGSTIVLVGGGKRAITELPARMGNKGPLLPVPSMTSDRWSFRVALIPHITMDLGMIVMLSMIGYR